MFRTLTLISLLLPVVATAADGMDAAATEKYQLASSKISGRSYGEAIALFNELAAVYPRVAEIFAGRCSAQVGAKAYAGAEVDCTYALRLKPELAAALFSLGMAQQGQGKREAAAASYRQYVALDPSAAPYRDRAQAQLTALEAGGPLLAADGTSGSRIVVYCNHVSRSALTNLVLDNKIVGPISLDQYVEIEVAPGEHLLEGRTALMDSYETPPMPISLRANETVYVTFAWHGTRVLEVMGAGQARAEIKSDCKKGFTRRIGPDSPQAPPMVSAAALVIGGGPGYGYGYGYGVRVGAGPKPECRMSSRGVNTCGYNCEMGSNGNIYCSSTPNGHCAFNSDGTWSCP